MQVSVLTPSGSGAIAVIRIAGREAASAADAFFRPVTQGNSLGTLSAGRLAYGSWVEGDEVIDDVIVGVAREDRTEVEVSCHGGPVITRRIVESLVRIGAEPAPRVDADSSWEPKDAVERDVFQALQRARTPRAALFLLGQRESLPVALRDAFARYRRDPGEGRRCFERLLVAAAPARRLVEGATAAIIGPPNAGKSTLLNALAGRQAALTSPHAGTTRDWVEAEIEFRGVALTFWDTAGLDAEGNALEVAAMESGLERMRGADLCVVVVDASRPDGQARLRRMERYAPHGRVVRVMNKLDKLGAAVEDPMAEGSAGALRCAVSALTGAGIERMLTTCLEALKLADFDDAAPALFSPRAAGIAEALVSPGASDRTLLDRAERAMFLAARGSECGDAL